MAVGGKPFTSYLRFQNPRTDPFSKAVSVFMAIMSSVCIAGILVFYYETSAQVQIVLNVPSTNFTSTCDPAVLLFGSQYFTTSANNASKEAPQIGMFPWEMGAFGYGNSSGEINYGIQQLNYTGSAFDCFAFYTSFVIHMDSGASTSQACYYCGDSIRVVCTTVDSERTPLTVQSVSNFPTLTANYAQVMVYALQNQQALLNAVGSTTTANLLSMTVRNYTAVPTIAGVVLGYPFNQTSADMYIGTTSGSFPLPDSLDGSVSGAFETYLTQASNYLKDITANDLNGRYLLIDYPCKQSYKVRKTTWGIIATLLAGLGAIFPTFLKVITFIMGILYPPSRDDTGIETPRTNQTDEEKVEDFNSSIGDSNTLYSPVSLYHKQNLPPSLTVSHPDGVQQEPFRASVIYHPPADVDRYR